ncbi:uncharacterized protein LOC128710825 [Anopheles marshallii]|uniref:uncharacterized protein LOC128710825 n=1 Tax=Anopheles marshallii TaxID=1521116 RepID=UPI00237A8DCA|nr:uncharacterized protein LOC128710825 [Anopheles marshallii]
MDNKKRFPGLIEHNKNSPLKILDVRSINETLPTSSYTLHKTEAAEESDDSSGSEKELVIDMEDPEPEPPDHEDEFFVQQLGLEIPHTVSKIELAPPSSSSQPAAKNRTNRRKSQHIRLENADIMFETPMDPVLAPEPEPEQDELQEVIESNRYIMQHIALLRTTINHLLQQHHQSTIAFPNKVSDFETVESWMESYEQIKYDTLPGTSQAKMKK